jgi:WD40 repeat protein
MRFESFIFCRKTHVNKNYFRTCAWGTQKPEEEETPAQETENVENENTENVEPPKAKGEEYDFIVSGSIGHGHENPEVKVWKVVNDKVKNLHTLSGHSLGVVSVDVSPNGKCKTIETSMLSILQISSKFNFRYCQQFTRFNIVSMEFSGWKTFTPNISWTCRFVDRDILARQ